MNVDASEIRDFAADLRKAGRQELAKEMLKGLRLAAKPIVAETRKVAAATLPQRGGLARRVSKAPQRVTSRAGRTSATVAIIVSGKKKGTGATGADAGLVRHPVFATELPWRGAWSTTRTPSGWFTKTAEEQAPAVDKRMGEVLDDIARQAGFRR